MVVVVHIRDAGLDRHPSHRGLICVTIGYKLLKLQSPAPNEAKRGADRAGAVDVPLPQRPQGVGVVESDPALLEVKAHAESRRQRVGDPRRCGRPVAVGDGVPDTVAVVIVVVVVAVLGQVDLTHPHCEEAKWGSQIKGVLCSAVMAAVRVVARQK